METRRERIYRQQKEQKSSKLWRITIGLFIMELVSMSYLGLLLWRNNLLNTNKVTLIGMSCVLLIILLQLFFVMFKKMKKTAFMLTILVIGSVGFATYRFQQVISLFNRFNQTQNVTELTMSVVALKDSTIKTVDQLNNKTILTPTTVDVDNTKQLLTDLATTKKVTLTQQNVESYHQAYEALKAKKAPVMVLSSTYESLLSQEDPEFHNKIVKIYEYKIKKEIKPKSVTTNQKTDVFHVYISGIDTYGPITEVSRSDVNIIATVNTATKQILLTSTPRDAYIKIADGGNNQYDKLTHAGIYGVDASMHTLENLYGIKFNYFLRVNFTTFMNLIDVVGGVDVNNAYYFRSTTVENKEFPAGKLHLNAEYALAYVRERYNLHDGDVGRAAHQEEVITQVLKKLLSTKLLTESDAIMNQLVESVQTDMTLNTVGVVLNQFTSNAQPFNIESQALEVEGKIGLPSYAMPGAQLWMGVVNKDHLSVVKQRMNDVVSGKLLDERSDASTTQTQSHR